jgi:hypothetical protein
MIEFGVGTPIIITLGAILLLTGPPILGGHPLLTGVNYVPLLIYAVIIVRRDTAQAEVVDYMSRDKHLVRKYSIQKLLLFLPLVGFWLAVWQELGAARQVAKKPD